MENREIRYSEDIVCPFCKKTLLNKEIVADYETCEHTIFVATDDGFEYIRDDMKSIINEDVDESYDSYTAQLPINGIRIADYPPPPALLGAYWGFID